MRVLILGGSGMLGHKLWQEYRNRFDTWVAIRSSFKAVSRYELFAADRTIEGVDVLNFDSIVKAVARVRPQVIVNAIGIIKQLPEAHDPLLSIRVNALFPHKLAQLCGAAEARLIHVSTDCVFSGAKGDYREFDTADGDDLYGRTKFLGELSSGAGLTLRTSVIGRELSSSSGLVEWFLQNRGGRVKGFGRAIYSGVTTRVFSRIVADLIERHPEASGLYHLASTPITKLELLRMLRDAYDTGTEVVQDAEVVIDRSLDGSRLNAVLGCSPPAWRDMIADLASDPTPYDRWRQ